MKHLLFRILVGFSLAAAILGPLLYGCRTARPAPVAAAAGAATAQAGTLPRLDSVVVQPPRSLLDKALDRQNVASSLKNVASDRLSGGKLRSKCKGCTFNIVAGDQTNSQTAKKGQSATGPAAALTNVEHARAPVTTGPGNATDQRKATQAAASSGSGPIGQTMPAPPPKRGFLAGLGAAVGAYVVPVLVVAALGADVWFGWPVMLTWWRRRKQAQS